MPFDATVSHREVLESEIRRLLRDPKHQAELATFSPWKIYPGKTVIDDVSKKRRRIRDGEFSYRLIRATGGVHREPGGFYLTNLVLQGGGTLGLAHAGFIRGLECMGFRFSGLAGTSAGAILATGGFAVRGDDLLTAMAPGLEKIIDDAPMHSFVDGPRVIRRLIKAWAAGHSLRHPSFAYAAWVALRRLLRKRGLNHGHVFEDWTAARLKSLDVATCGDLTNRMARIANDLRDAVAYPSKANPFAPKSKGRSALEPEAIFKVISVAMPTGMKFVLPRDLDLLHQDYGDLPAARLVRMSMSIPLFFEPVTMGTSPKRWPDHIDQNYAGFVADDAVQELRDIKQLSFLDGGLFSNLPTAAMVEGMPDEIGSISVPLVSRAQSVSFKRRNTPGALAGDAMAVFNAVRLNGDREAHHRFTRHKITNHKVMKIDTGQANWLNFNMSQAEKEELFLAGLERARNALRDGDFV